MGQFSTGGVGQFYSGANIAKLRNKVPKLAEYLDKAKLDALASSSLQLIGSSA
ncbi:MAG: hypothetical protein NVSMB64_10660 [Candidatus Velthaea sp.]